MRTSDCASTGESIIDAGWLEYGHSTGLPIIGLHGFPQTADAWIPVAKLLAERGHRVIIPRQRGYTVKFRPRGRWNYRISCLSKDIIRLMDHLAIDRAHVAGHDLGATVAWDLATWNPERVATVFSLGAPHPGGFLLDVITNARQVIKAWYFMLAQLPLIPEILFSPSGRASRLRFARFLQQTGLSTNYSSLYLNQISEDALFTAAVNWYRAMPCSSIRRILRKASRPAFIIWGVNDPLTSRRSVELSARFVQSALRVERVPDAGHWLLDSRSKEVASLIASILSELRGG